jgi:hypothetical protein
VDANTRLGLVSGYYFVDDYRLDDPYPGQQGGANVPGFNALTLGRAQLVSVGTNTVLSRNLVNEFHASFMRSANNVGVPNGGKGVSLQSQGFVTGPGTPGIVVLAPELEGVENLVFNTFTTGVTITGVNQTNQTSNASHIISKVRGNHTLKAGGQFQFGEVQLIPNATFNGTFTFAGTETGNDFADFLLGIPSNYIQSNGGIFHLRNKYGALFAQDSWRARSNVTMNYGLRWDVIQPCTRGQRHSDDRPWSASNRLPAGAARPGLSRGCWCRARAVADALGKLLSPAGNRVRAQRQNERAWELRNFLHGLSRIVGRHHVRRPAVRLQLPQSSPAVIRSTVHHGR